MWKNIASFVLGAALGGAAVYFSCKEKFRKEEQEAIDAVKKYYKERDEKRAKEVIDELNNTKSKMSSLILGSKMVANESTEEGGEESKESNDSADEPPSSETPLSNKTNYSAMYEQKGAQKTVASFEASEANGKEIVEKALQEWSEDGDEEDIFVDDEPEDYDEEEEYIPSDYHPTDDMNQPPYSIGQNDFINGNPYYDKSDFLYYEDDNVLIDSYTEEEIYDLSNTVGPDFTIHFDEELPDMAYIRNDSTGSDYSIMRIHGRYYPPEED